MSIELIKYYGAWQYWVLAYWTAFRTKWLDAPECYRQSFHAYCDYEEKLDNG